MTDRAICLAVVVMMLRMIIPLIVMNGVMFNLMRKRMTRHNRAKANDQPRTGENLEGTPSHDATQLQM